MPVRHLLLHLLFIYIATAILHADGALHVVELAAVQLQELYEEDAQIHMWPVQLVGSRMQLQETDAHQDEAVAGNSTREHFIQVPLQQKLLQHIH